MIPRVIPDGMPGFGCAPHNVTVPGGKLPYAKERPPGPVPFQDVQKARSELGMWSVVER
jgi:hypothetical protein